MKITSVYIFTKDNLLVTKPMKYFSIDEYVDNFLKKNVLGHLITCVYQYTVDNMEEIPNTLHFFVSWIGTMY